MNKTTLDEIRIGNECHYKLDVSSGFWISQIPTDPQSATLTPFEMGHIIESHIAAGVSLRRKLNKRLRELRDTLKAMKE